MARVLLIQPNENIKCKKTPVSTFTPLGIIYLGTHIEDRHSVKIYDRNLNNNDAQFLNTLKTYKPDIVGFTSGASTMLFDIIHLGKLIKKTQPDAIIVVGGVHATFDPDCFLNESYIDYVIRGEGEEAFLDFCNTFDKNPKKLSKLLNINKNPLRPFVNIDDLKTPNYNLVDIKKYDEFFVSLSRGCPGNCNFCYNAQMWGKKNHSFVRIYSLKKAMELFRKIHEEYKIKVFHMVDDNFLFFKQRCIEICKFLENYNFHFYTSGRVDNIDDEILSALKKAGCHTVFVGVESGSQRVLDFLGKRTTLQQNINAIKLCKKHNIICDASFMIGIPTETPAELRETMDFIKKYDPDIPNVKIYNPLPARLFEYCAEKGLIKRPKTLEEWANFGGVFGFNNNVSKIPDKELRKAVKEAARHKFLKRNIKKFIFWIKIGELKHAFQSSVKILRNNLFNQE